MNYTHKSILAIGMAMLFVTSCKKSDYDSGSNTILAVNSADLLDEFHTEPTKFSVTAGVKKEVVGPQGTFLRFYPNSFKDKNGNNISSGTVDVELTEMYSAGDILKYHTSTNTGSTVCTSGGQAFIKATMNGEAVTANKYGIGFNADSTPSTGARKLSYGNTYAAEGIVTWYDGSDDIGKTVAGAGPIANTTAILPSSRYYMFDSSTEFNWVASQQVYGGAFQYVTIKVKLANESFAGNVWSTVYTTLSSDRVATILYQESFDRNTQTGTYKGWVLTGTAMKFMFVIPRNKDVWYYYKTQHLLSDGLTIDATLTIATKDEMNAALKAF